MKVVLALICLVAAATAQILFPAIQKPTGRPTHHEEWRQIMENLRMQMEEDRMTMEKERQRVESNRPHWSSNAAVQMGFIQKLSDMRKTAMERKKQWEEARAWWDTMRPTGRPSVKQAAGKAQILFPAIQKPSGRPTHHEEWRQIMESLRMQMEEDRMTMEKERQRVESNRPHWSANRAAQMGFIQKLSDVRKTAMERKKQWEEARAWWDTMKPTGRPQVMQWNAKRSFLPVDLDAKTKMHKTVGMKRSSKSFRWASEQLLSEGNDADETEILSPFETHIGSFKSNFDKLMAQHQGRKVNGLEGKLRKLFNQHLKNIKGARPTGRPTRKDQQAFLKAHKALQEAKKDATDRIQKVKDAARQKQLEKLKTKAAPFMVHVQNFREALEKFFNENQAATEDELVKKIDDLYDQFHDQIKLARPTGTPAPGDKRVFRFAHNKLRKAKADARDKVNERFASVKKAALEAKVKPFLAHAESFKSAFNDLLGQNPTGTKKELNKMIQDLYKQHLAKMSGLRPTGRPSPDHNKAYNVAKKILLKHRQKAVVKLEAWRKKMKAVLGQNDY